WVHRVTVALFRPELALFLECLDDLAEPSGEHVDRVAVVHQPSAVVEFPRETDRVFTRRQIQRIARRDRGHYLLAHPTVTSLPAKRAVGVTRRDELNAD